MAINPYESVLRQLEQKNAQDIATAQQGARTQAQESYINYMNSLKNLNQGLRSQGITGGGSESALLGANVGYQRQKNLVAGNLAQNLQGLSQNYMANRSAVETQKADWESQRQAQEEQRFANTITGFDTIGKVDNAIQVAQTAGETWKIGYLMAQRAALVEQAKAIAAEETARAESVRAANYSSPVVSAPEVTPTQQLAANNDFTTGYSSQGIPYSSGGLSGTQARTPVAQPTAPVTTTRQRVESAYHSRPQTKRASLNPYYGVYLR